MSGRTKKPDGQQVAQQTLMKSSYVLARSGRRTRAVAQVQEDVIREACNQASPRDPPMQPLPNPFGEGAIYGT